VIKLLSARIKSKHDQASKSSDDQAFKLVKKVLHKDIWNKFKARAHGDFFM
jgi:hypothetical protein